MREDRQRGTVTGRKRQMGEQRKWRVRERCVEMLTCGRMKAESEGGEEEGGEGKDSIKKRQDAVSVTGI